MISTSTLGLPGLSIPAQGSQVATVRLLSLWQPWATLVAIGAKTIETRSWQTPYRGKIAIHASLNTPAEQRALCYSDPFFKPLYHHVRPQFEAGASQQGNAIYRMLPKGCIVATCDLIDCWQVSGTPKPYYGPYLGYDAHGGNKVWTVPPPEPELNFGNYAPGRWAWILDNIKPLAEPLPWKGAQGLRAIQWPENISGEGA